MRERERRKEREKRKKIKENEKKERKMKEAGGFFLCSLAFRQSELVEPRRKFEDSTRGYASRGKDSSYFGLLLAFGLLF